MSYNLSLLIVLVDIINNVSPAEMWLYWRQQQEEQQQHDYRSSTFEITQDRSRSSLVCDYKSLLRFFILLEENLWAVCEVSFLNLD